MAVATVLGANDIAELSQMAPGAARVIQEPPDWGLLLVSATISIGDLLGNALQYRIIDVLDLLMYRWTCLRHPMFSVVCAMCRKYAPWVQWYAIRSGA